MAKKTVLECDACQKAIETSEIDTLLLGIPTGKFQEANGLPTDPIFVSVHACKACADQYSLSQLNARLRNRPA